MMDPSQQQFRPCDTLRLWLDLGRSRVFLWDPGGKPLLSLVDGQVC
jgi:hypothetical protein